MVGSKVAPVFKALGDNSRLKIITALGKKDCTVDELRISLKISQSSTSQHLKLLLEANLVSYTKHGNFRIYSLQRNELAKTMRYFNALWDTDLAKLKSTLERNG